LAESFGLAEILPRLVSTFSSGLRQRLHLALGVLHEPELLLLDEPTGHLDPAGRSFVWHFLQRLRSEDRTTIVVSHDLAEVSQHCQTIALLHRGRLLASGSPADVIAAHANWRLEVELAGRVEQDTSRFQQLVSLPGVKNVYAAERQLVAHLAEREASVVQQVTGAIFQQLVRLNAPVLGYRLHPPDLASAYFNLTGAAIEERGRSGLVETDKGVAGRHRREQESIG
jgi:ABC-type multidrug transport system ATPase subunit